MEMKKALKRSVAMLLAVVMTLSTITFTWAEPAAAAEPTTTLGKLLAENYDSLTEGEKNLLKAGLLTETGYTFKAPDANNGDGKVSIDAKSKTVTAKVYENGGYKWIPVSAQLMVNDKAYGASFELTKGEGDAYTGSFSYDGTSYGVAVTYKMSIAVPMAEQGKLLDAAADLKAAGAASAAAKDGVGTLNEILQAEVNFSKKDFTSNVAGVGLEPTKVWEIFSILNPKDVGGLPVTASQPNGTKVSWSSASEDEQIRLLELTNDAKDGTLAVLDMWKSGGAAASVAAMSANSSTVSEALKKVLSQGELTQKATGDLNSYTNKGALKEAVEQSMAQMAKDLQTGANFDWSVIAGLVKTGADAKQLESLLAAAEVSNTVANKAELLADTTVVTANMAQATVNVVVKADVIRPGMTKTDTLTVDSGSGAVVRLPAKAGVDKIAEAIVNNGFEKSALESWTAYEVGQENYTRKVEVSPAVGEAGLVDGTTYTYTITYTPKTFAVSATGCDDIQSGELPYGYNLTLPVKAGEGEVWDYTVNGEARDQGSVIRIVGATTITRVAGKAWEKHDLGTLVAQFYAPDDTAANQILKQNALLTGSVRLRTPSVEDKMLQVAAVESGYTVTATTYHANTGDLYWIPVTATPVVGGVNQAAVSFTKQEDGTYVANIADEFDTVNVRYELNLPWAVTGMDAASATELLNLPYALAQDARGQLDALKTMADQYGNLENVNKKINLIRSTIVGGKEILQETKDAAENLVLNCCDSDKNLLMFGYVSAYKDLNGAGRLTYFYKNSESFAEQLDYLKEYLTIISRDPGLEKMLIEADMGEYYGKIDKVSNALQETYDQLKAPNEAINVNAPEASLRELATAIIANMDTVKQYGTVTKNPVLAINFSAAGIGKKTVTVQIIVKNSDGTIKNTFTGTKTFNNDEGQDYVTVTPEMKEAIGQVVGELMNGVDAKHYTTEQTFTTPDKLEGDVTLTAVYVPKEYTVNFVDEQGDAIETQTFPYDNPVISLPACGEIGFRYDYALAGTVITATNGKYTFNTEDAGFDALFTTGANPSCTITRTTVNVAREKILSSVDALNKAIAAGEGMTFSADGKNCLRVALIPYEQDGKMTLVLRVTPDAGMKVQSVLKDAAEELLNYETIQVGSNGQYLLKDGKVDVQSLVDVLLNSGLGLSTVLSSITAEGDLVESSVDGAPVWALDDSNGMAVGTGYINDLTKIGCRVLDVETKLENTPVTVTVTVEDFDRNADQLKKSRSLAETVMNKGIDATLANGNVNISANSNMAYKMLMAAALVLNRADVNNVTENGWDLSEIVPELYYSLVQPIVDDPTSSTETIQNTLTKLGITKYDVTKYQRYFRIAKALLRNTSFADTTGDAQNLKSQVSVSLEEALGKITNQGLKDMVEQRLINKSITGGVNLTLTHSDNYAAVVMHAQKSVSGLVKFIKSSNDSSFTVSQGNTAIVLLDDSCKQITVEEGCNNVIIDLNGHRLGKVICSEKDRVIVINSYLTKGGLTDAGNATDGSALAKTLYSMDRSTDENGENITVSMIPDLSAWKDAGKVRRNVLALAAEAVAEVAMNYGNATKKLSVVIDGQEQVLYDLQVNDMVDMVDTASVAGTGNTVVGYLNLDGINALANDLIRKFSDFGGINEAISAGDAIASYTITATGFGLEASVAEGDYINVSTKDGKSDVINLSVKLDSDEQYKGGVNRIQGVLRVLEDTVTVDESTMVELKSILVSGNRSDAAVDVEGAATVKAKISATHDVNYVILPAMIVADSLPAGDALRAELLNGITEAVNGQGQDALKNAVEKVTMKQLISALKALSAKPMFSVLAAKLGLNIVLDGEEAALMNSYGDILYAGAVALSRANITGTNGTLAGCKTETYGVYNIGCTDKVVDISRTVRMLTGTAMATFNIDLTAELFTHEKSIVVKGHDGSIRYNGDDLAEALSHINDDDEGVTLVLNKAQTLTGDVEVTVPLTVEGEALDMSGHKFLLKDTAASVTMDGLTAEMVESAVEGWYVVVSENTAALKQYVAKANDTYCKSLDVAVALLNGSGKLQLLAEASMTANIEVTGTMTVKGADKINQGTYTFVLKTADAKLISDAALKVTTDLDGYEVKKDGTTYTVARTTPQVVDKGYLKLDVKPKGINASELQTALRNVLNMPNATVEVLSGVTNGGLVANGSVAKVTNGNAVYQYTIVIMGDTNCDGMTNAGDGVLLRRHFQKDRLLTGVALMAADMTQDGKINAGDGVRIRVKFQNWAGYSSSTTKIDI